MCLLLVSCKEISSKKTRLISFLKSKLLCGVAKTVSFDKHVLALDIIEKKFQAKDKAYKLFKVQTSTWRCKNGFV
jgi:hypothetical protein